MHNCSVDDFGTNMLAQLTQLKRLNMAYSLLMDSGALRLCKLTGLTYLSLDSRLITDRGLAQLPALRCIEALDLFGCKVLSLPLQRSAVLHTGT